MSCSFWCHNFDQNQTHSHWENEGLMYYTTKFAFVDDQSELWSGQTGGPDPCFNKVDLLYKWWACLFSSLSHSLSFPSTSLSFPLLFSISALISGKGYSLLAPQKKHLFDVVLSTATSILTHSLPLMHVEMEQCFLLPISLYKSVQLKGIDGCSFVGLRFVLVLL